MTTESENPRRRRFAPLAISLVTLQFLLAGGLVLSTPMPPTGIVVWTLLLAGAGIAVWAWLTMGIRKIRVLPAPGGDAKLVDEGPYAFIRHPMYSGLLLLCAGLLLHAFSPWRLLLWLALLGVLIVKAVYEERMLIRDMPGYEQYRRRTWAFLPWI